MGGSRLSLGASLPSLGVPPLSGGSHPSLRGLSFGGDPTPYLGGLLFRGGSFLLWGVPPHFWGASHWGSPLLGGSLLFRGVHSSLFGGSPVLLGGHPSFGGPLLGRGGSPLLGGTPFLGDPPFLWGGIFTAGGGGWGALPGDVLTLPQPVPPFPPKLGCCPPTPWPRGGEPPQISPPAVCAPPPFPGPGSFWVFLNKNRKTKSINTKSRGLDGGGTFRGWCPPHFGGSPALVPP